MTHDMHCARKGLFESLGVPNRLLVSGTVDMGDIVQTPEHPHHVHLLFFLKTPDPLLVLFIGLAKNFLPSIKSIKETQLVSGDFLS